MHIKFRIIQANIISLFLYFKIKCVHIMNSLTDLQHQQVLLTHLSSQWIRPVHLKAGMFPYSVN